MRRRRLLALLSAGAAAATAGCGYAPGGGDLRRREDVVTSFGDIGDRTYATDGTRFAVASNFEAWSVVEDPDPPDWEQATVTVASRSGEVLWEYTHDRPAAAVALGDRGYLLSADDVVVAFDSAEPAEHGADDAQSSERDVAAQQSGRDDTPVGEAAWRVPLGEPVGPLVAAGHGAYLADGGSLVRLRDGGVRWEAQLDGRLLDLRATEDAVLAVSEDRVATFSPEGERRFTVPIEGHPSVAAADGRAAVRDLHEGDGQLVVVGLDDGEQLWSASPAVERRSVTLSADRVYLHGGGELLALDAATGERRWRAAAPGLGPTLVGASEGAYVVRDCEVVATGPGGVRWRRSLGRTCSTVAAWLDGDALAVLLADGDVVWLERTGSDRGLL